MHTALSPVRRGVVHAIAALQRRPPSNLHPRLTQARAACAPRRRLAAPRSLRNPGCRSCPCLAGVGHVFTLVLGLALILGQQLAFPLPKSGRILRPAGCVAVCQWLTSSRREPVGEEDVFRRAVARVHVAPGLAAPSWGQVALAAGVDTCLCVYLTRCTIVRRQQTQWKIRHNHRNPVVVEALLIIRSQTLASGVAAIHVASVQRLCHCGAGNVPLMDELRDDSRRLGAPASVPDAVGVGEAGVVGFGVATVSSRGVSTASLVGVEQRCPILCLSKHRATSDIRDGTITFAWVDIAPLGSPFRTLRIMRRTELTVRDWIFTRLLGGPIFRLWLDDKQHVAKNFAVVIYGDAPVGSSARTIGVAPRLCRARHDAADGRGHCHRCLVAGHGDGSQCGS
mmetsp:Transcript_40461/g.97035  ORF Transcript_40461/g.97035 Transcript_40461/m.97035 type:complete len:396 (-) Transcript_40461:48-1235(-)